MIMAAEGDQAPELGGVEVPFQVGSSDSKINFSNPEARERWLKTQPVDVAMVMAARAALRPVPVLSIARGSTGSRLTRRRMILRVFRAVAAAWAVSAFPGKSDALTDAAREAVLGLGDVRATPPERAAAYALAALLESNENIPARAATAVGYALDAAGEKGQVAFDNMLAAIETDANLLSERFSAVTIATSQLWPSRPPDWVRESWEELKGALLAENEGWHVWSLWYEARLFGDVLRQELEVARVLIADELWHREPRSLNARIQELIDENEAPAGQGETQAAQGAGRAGTINPAASSVTPVSAQVNAVLGQVVISATAEVVPDPTIEAVVLQIKSNPQVFEEAARFAARSIERELKNLAAKIPNEPGALEGYHEVRAVLQRLQNGFEGLAASVEEARAVPDEADQSARLRKVVSVAKDMCAGFVDWLDEHGNRAGRVIAELGLAGLISGTLSYYTGVPPMLTFPVTVAAMSGQSIWEAIKAFAPNKEKAGKDN